MLSDDRDLSLRIPRLASCLKIDSLNQKGITYSWKVFGETGGAPIIPHSGIAFEPGRTDERKNIIMMIKVFAVWNTIVLIVRKSILIRYL